jgi:hypothetical protein
MNRQPGQFRVRLELTLASVAVVAVLLVSSVSRRMLPGAFNDDAAYLALGRAFSSGAGYHSIYLVGSPFQVKYPPGFPAVLALLWEIAKGPAQVHALAVAVNIVACAIAGSILWWIARVRLGIRPLLTAAFVVLPFALDPAVQYFTLVLSEPLFLLATAISLLLYGRLRTFDVDVAVGSVEVQRFSHNAERETVNARRSLRSSGVGRAASLGLALAAAALFRTQGTVLIIAILAAVGVDSIRRRNLPTVAALSILPLTVWYAFAWHESRHAGLAAQASEQSYAAFLSGGTPLTIVLREAGTMRANLADYLSTLGTYLTAVPLAGRLLALALAVLGVVGTALLLRRDRALAFVLVANAVVLLAWPVYQDRFLFALLPLFGVAVGYALDRLLLPMRAPVRSEWLNGMLSALVALAGAGCVLRQHFIRVDAELARRSGRQPAVASPSYWLPLNSAFVSNISEWVAQRARRDDRIAVVAPAGVWLYTGRQTVPMEIVEPRAAPSVFDVPGRYLRSRIMADSVTLVVVETPFGLTAREVAAVRKACPNALRLVDSFSGISVFRARADDECLMRDGGRATGDGATSS